MADPTPDAAANLQLAAGRLRRTQWVWAGLLGAAAVLQALSLRAAPSPAGWLDVAVLAAGAALLAVSVQPAYLALVAVLWGASLIRLVPGVAQTFGPDILVGVLGETWLELAAAALVRIVLMVTAWNQFMLYRLLYGTASFSGMDPAAAPIPEVIPNRTDRLASVAMLLGSLALVAVLIAVPLLGEVGPLAAHAALGFGTFALGLGLGAAFSPTRRRGAALWALALGAAAILGALIVGAWSLR